MTNPPQIGQILKVFLDLNRSGNVAAIEQLAGLVSCFPARQDSS